MMIRRTARAIATLGLVVALSTVSSIQAFADDPIVQKISVTDPDGNTTTVTIRVSSGSVTTDGTTVTLDAPTVDATTTGTTATVSPSESTATVGTLGGTGSVDTSGMSTGTGATTVDRSLTTSGAGLSPSGTAVSTTIMDSGSPALFLLIDQEMIDQRLAATLDASEPVTRSSVSAGVQASALLCLLSQASVDGTWASLSSPCSDDASTADGAIGLTGSNGITGTTIATGTAAHAALCLLGFAASPAPGTIGANTLATASLSTLCGATPSIASGAGSLGVTEDRTGTTIAAAPAVALATCILAKASVGTTTLAHLATLCAPAAGGSPSTVAGSSPVSLSDGATGLNANAAPAVDSAICLLADALVTVPADPSDAAAVADLRTACGSGAGTTPSSVSGTAPTAASVGGGTSGGTSPSGNAALCLLASAGANVSTATLEVANACGTTPGTTPTTEAKTGTGPAGDGVGSVGAGQGNATNPSGPVLGFENLPSTSTAVAGIGLGLLLVAIGLGVAFSGRRRQRIG